MHSYFITLLIICPLVLCAGFVDAAAGGGGLISLPAYIFAGVPIHTAYGTNKFANCIGTSVASIKFFKSGKLEIKTALLASGGALIGSALGAKLTLLLSEIYLQYCLIIILPIVSIFLIFNRNFGEDVQNEIDFKKLYPIVLLVGVAIGIYDGFFGPGTGTFLVLAFTSICKFNIIISSGNAKMVNLASNLSALIVFLLNGKVAIMIGIPAAIASIIGNYIGAHFAIKKGVKFIKPIILIVIIMLFSKIVISLF
ncbi:TSUP family transporter [Clostridioides difficile]